MLSLAFCLFAKIFYRLIELSLEVDQFFRSAEIYNTEREDNFSLLDSFFLSIVWSFIVCFLFDFHSLLDGYLELILVGLFFDFTAAGNLLIDCALQQYFLRHAHHY